MPWFRNKAGIKTFTSDLAKIKVLEIGGDPYNGTDGTSMSGTELAYLDSVTPGTVTASKAVVVDSNKDIGDFRNLDAVNIDAGADASAGTVDIFPATTASGKMILACADNGGAFNVTITNASHGQSTAVTIPDSGLATAYLAQSTAALTVGEVDVLDGATAGTIVASKAVVSDANTNIGIVKATELHIGATGAETQVTASAAELNYCDVTAAGTAEASKALVVDGSVDIAGINSLSATTLTDGTLSINSGAITACASIAAGNAGLTPATDVAALVVTGTNIAAAHVFDLNGLALTTGCIIDIAAITTKTSGYLYNGSMTTSTLDASTLLDDFSVSCAHDGLAADTLRCIRRTWSGAMPNGTANADFAVFEGIVTSTVGSGGAEGGTVKIYNADLTGATINGSAADVYGVYASTSGLTNTSSNSIYGIYGLGDGTAETAVGYFSDGTNTVLIGDGSYALNITGPTTIGTFGTGLALTDSLEDGIELYLEPTIAFSAGKVTRGLRSRYEVSTAQTNNVSIYATEGHLRVKSNMAAGVHAGLFGYLEQSETVTLSSSDAFNAACNLGVETASTLTVDAGVNLAGCVITSNIDSGITNNGNVNGIIIRKESGKLDWENGITFNDCVSSALIQVTDTAAPVYMIDLDGASGANGTITSDSGTAATVWKARIKVKTDDGTDGWINVYSTSNEA